MEKVKLTQEQADAIRFVKRMNSIDFNIKKQLNKTWKERTSLHSLSLDEFIRAIYIGYEVEQSEFEIGDYVVNGMGTIGRIESIDPYGIFRGYWEDISMECHKSNFVRHATTEEIAKLKHIVWWQEHNRAVWELKDGDELVANSLGRQRFIVINQNDKQTTLFKLNHANTPYSIVDNKDLEELYKVKFFAEDRKDDF